MMIKRYKATEDGELLYLEAWYDQDESTVVVHYGKVGFVGNSEEYRVDDDADAADFIEEFDTKCQTEGYLQIAEDDQYWVAVQYPLKSKFGNKRDLWLKEKVQDYLNDHLGWRGLGEVDGFDIGNKQLNIFCVVVDADKAVSSIKTCLKENRLDLTRAIIASKRYNDDEYQLRYSHDKVDKFELI